MQKAPWGIITGFEVVIQVFDGRIVLRIFRVQKCSQTQTFSNKASFLCPQGCVLLKMHQNYSYGTKEARCAIRYE